MILQKRPITPMRESAAMPESPTPESSTGERSGPGCGCRVQDSLEEERDGVGVDPAIKDRNLKRLRRIEGQVRGLQKMIEDDRYCADIMTQISSVHEALRAVGRELMRNHLKHCASSAIRAGNSGAEPMYDELIEMMYKLSR